MATWIEPLDLPMILVNLFSGSMSIFIFLSVLCIASMAAYFRMTFMTTSLMIFFYVLMLRDFIGTIWGTTFTIFAGLILFSLLGKITKQ